jgi:hypothetical protein
VLSNLENLNSEFIKQKMSQEERLINLNTIAISQMKLLTQDARNKLLGGKKDA